MSGLGPREKAPPAVPPPSAASGRVSALSGSSSSGAALPARAVPHPTPPALCGPDRSARASHPSLLHLVCFRPTPSVLCLPRYPNPRRRPSSLNSSARDPVTRGTVIHPTDRNRPRSRRLSLARWVRAGANTRPVRWLAGAHAPERAAGRGEQLEPGRGRCGSAGAPAPSRGCDSQPAAGREGKRGKGRAGAGRRAALEELGEERGGDGGGSRRGEGGGGAPFLFSDPERLGRRARNWGDAATAGPRRR